MLAEALLVVRRLTTAEGWNDRHRLALIVGASLASMLGGVMAVVAAPPADRIGKLVFDVVAIVAFGYLARRVRQRT